MMISRSCNDCRVVKNCVIPSILAEAYAQIVDMEAMSTLVAECLAAEFAWICNLYQGVGE